MNFKSNLFDKVKKDTIRVAHDEQNAADVIAKELFTSLPSALHSRPIVFVCIGTDRSTGDSLGPLIGSLLVEKDIQPFHIYGSLENPIHALNLADKLSEIQSIHKNPFIIGIDACLGRLKSVGIIQIGMGPVKPGSGVNKDLPNVGDMHITGIVNVSGFMEYFVLQNTRLHLIMEMAKAIANGIHNASIAYKPKHTFSKLQWTLGHDQEKTL